MMILDVRCQSPLILLDEPSNTVYQSAIRDFTSYNIITGGSVDFHFMSGSRYTIPGDTIKKCKPIVLYYCRILR